MTELRRERKPTRCATVKPEDWAEGTDVVVHTDHIFLRQFDGKKGKVVGVGTYNDHTVEVSFDWITAEFYPSELEVADGEG